MNEEEQYLHEAILELQRSYSEAIKPYVDRLARIQSMKPPAPILIECSTESIAELEQRIGRAITYGSSLPLDAYIDKEEPKG